MSTPLRHRFQRARIQLRHRLRTEAKAARTDHALAQGGLAFLIAYAIMYALGTLGIG